MTILDSKIPGPNVVILGGIHGNETCGLTALESIKKWNIRRGRVILEIGNPAGVEQNIRFTETNLNRMFLPETAYTATERTSYEYQRAQYLKTLLDEADVLLDIHASNTPGSIPFLICEDDAAPFAKYLPGTIRCSGFSKTHPGSTDWYMNNAGKPAICIECGYTKDPASHEIATDAARLFLQSLSMLSGNSLSSEKQQILNAYAIYYTKSPTFTLAKEFGDFERITPGTLIGYDNETPVISEKEQYILFARNRSKIGDEGFVLLEEKG